MRDRRHNAEWTVARIAKLTELWCGGSSASQIATALDCGFTRNAVIGKVTRLKLTRDPNAAPKPDPEVPPEMSWRRGLSPESPGINPVATDGVCFQVSISEYKTPLLPENLIFTESKR